MKCIRTILSAFISEQMRLVKDEMRQTKVEQQKERNELEALQEELRRVTKELRASNGTVIITVHTTFSCLVCCRSWQTWLTHFHSYVVEPS